MATWSRTFWMMMGILWAGVTTGYPQSITGQILGEDDGAPLIGATVIQLNTDPPIGTVTDFAGQFNLAQPNWSISVTLTISYAGYEPQTVHVKPYQGPINLSLSSMELEEVVVTSSRSEVSDLLNISSVTIDTSHLQRTPGGFGDVARVVQSFAGVQAVSDESNSLIVRGNSPRSLLWRVEGINIPNPNHFAGYQIGGGPLNIINSNTIESAEFYSGAFPSALGNSLSSAFDIRLRNGKSDRHHLLAQFGFNGAEVLTEGPISKKKGFSYLVDFRYSALTMIDAMGLIDFDLYGGVPAFQDLTFKLNFPTRNKGSFSLFGIGGASQSVEKSSSVFAKEEVSEEAMNNALDRMADEEFKTFMGVLGFNYKHLLTDDTYLKLSMSYAGSAFLIDQDTLYDQTTSSPQFNQQLNQEQFIAGLSFLRNVMDNKAIEVGLNFTRFFFNYQYQDDTGEQPYLNRDANGHGDLLNSYINWELPLNPKLSLLLGLHSQFFLLNNSYTLEPRVHAEYKLTDRHRLTAALGWHSQLAQIAEYFVQVPDPNSGELRFTNRDLDFMRSRHAVLGYDWDIAQGLFLHAEVYHQSHTDIPVNRDTTDSWSMLNEGADFETGVKPTALINEGTGQNYGLEVTLEKRLSRGWSVMGNGSVFRARYKGSDGVDRNSAFNTGWTANFTGGKAWVFSEKHTLTFDFKGTFGGGKRYAPLLLEESRLAGTTVRDRTQDFSLQYPDYLRADIRVGYIFKSKKHLHDFGLDFQNITNRENVNYEAWSASADEVITFTQLGFIPVFTYRFVL